MQHDWRQKVNSVVSDNGKPVFDNAICHNWTFFDSSYRWDATRQNVSKRTALGEGGSVWAKISEGRGRPGGIFLVFTKLFRYILPSVSANCTVLRAVVLTQYRRVTDGRTDGRKCYIASTALAMRALRRAVKTKGGTFLTHSVVTSQ